MSDGGGGGGHDRRRRRRRTPEAAHADERWLITYADMITLLMVFFIVMFASAVVNQEKFEKVIAAMSAAFSLDVMSGADAVGVGPDSASEMLPDPGLSASGAAQADYVSISAGLRDFAVLHGLEGKVEVEAQPGAVTIRIAGSLLFPSGRDELDAAAGDLLEKVAQMVLPLPNAIRIEGHTDDIPPSNGPFSDNWHLSTARAISVLDQLVADGLPPVRLSAAGYAEFRPLVPNSDEANRARNRRVDLVLLYPEQPLTDSSGSPIGDPIGQPFDPGVTP